MDEPKDVPTSGRSKDPSFPQKAEEPQKIDVLKNVTNASQD